MFDATKIFLQFLKENDLKNTPERMIIMQEIVKLDDHFDAETLLDHFKKVDIKISRASIYRTLELLVNCGLIKKVNFNNNSYHYESVNQENEHDHFICLKCDQIIEFYDEDIKNIHSRLIGKYNIYIKDYIHQVYGICAECKNKNES